MYNPVALSGGLLGLISGNNAGVFDSKENDKCFSYSS